VVVVVMVGRRMIPSLGVGTQNMVAEVVQAHIHLRLRMVVVLSTVLAEVVLVTRQEPLQAVLAVRGAVIPAVVVEPVESMMALAVMMEILENLDVVMAAEAAGEAHLLGWDSAVMAECQAVAAAVVGET